MKKVLSLSMLMLALAACSQESSNEAAEVAETSEATAVEATEQAAAESTKEVVAEVVSESTEEIVEVAEEATEAVTEEASDMATEMEISANCQEYIAAVEKLVEKTPEAGKGFQEGLAASKEQWKSLTEEQAAQADEVCKQSLEQIKSML